MIPRPGSLRNSLCRFSFGVFSVRDLGVRDIPARFPEHPSFPPSKPKEDKLSREGTNFSTPTPSQGRPLPHPTISGPIKLICVLFFQKFRKGVGGQRGLARGDPSYARDSDLFLCPFSYAILRRRSTQFWGSVLAALWALLVANLLPPTPFRNL